MCTNLCPSDAIKMTKGVHGFIFPEISADKCTGCGLCAAKCPATSEKKTKNTISNVYAAFNKDRKTQKKSTSGGIFTLIANEIIRDKGLVAGVRWNESLCPEHALTDNADILTEFRGSKYAQSNTKSIYTDVKQALNIGRTVLFSGTPCQVAALKAFLGKDEPNLFTVDLVCHGVPSHELLERYLSETARGRQIKKVNLRHKSPYWDYCSVRIDFARGKRYQKYTVDDPYFTLFNIGYSLRESCHTCKFTTTHREGDITLADFWGYLPSSAKMQNFNRGVSLVAVNTKKGEELFNRISKYINFEKKTHEAALQTNKSLSEPFTLPKESLEEFWKDYETGMTVDALCKKHVKKPFKLPKLLCLRRLKRKYSWVLKHK